MMTQSNFQRTSSLLTSNEMAQTRKRLIQEISCLERQVIRLQQYNQYVHNSTPSTYEEMISSRQEMLDSLGL